MSNISISREAILSQILKLREEEIKTALSLTNENDYKIVRIPKKSGGCRILYIPPKPLKKVQRKILKCLFQKLWRTPWVGIYGIYKGTSYVKHAQEHRQAKWVFQLDLRDAFPSVDVESLREILQRRLLEEMEILECSIRVYRDASRDLKEAGKACDEWEVDYYAREMEKCKKKISVSPFRGTALEQLMVKGEEANYEEIGQELADLIIKLTTFRGILPQGTPTAPFLFYISLAEGGLFAKVKSLFPNIIPESQDRYQFQVSVYIDNFVISAQKPIPPKNRKELFKTIEEFGFKVNPRKTWQQAVRSGAPLITGLRIANGRIILPKRKVRQWRGLIHRAIFKPDLRPKVEGFVASLKPIYGSRLPPQLEKPYQKLLQQIVTEKEKRGYATGEVFNNS